jgi:hypothetical protein
MVSVPATGRTPVARSRAARIGAGLAGLVGTFVALEVTLLAGLALAVGLGVAALTVKDRGDSRPGWLVGAAVGAVLAVAVYAVLVGITQVSTDPASGSVPGY